VVSRRVAPTRQVENDTLGPEALGHEVEEPFVSDA